MLGNRVAGNVLSDDKSSLCRCYYQSPLTTFQEALDVKRTAGRQGIAAIAENSSLVFCRSNRSSYRTGIAASSPSSPHHQSLRFSCDLMHLIVFKVTHVPKKMIIQVLHQRSLISAALGAASLFLLALMWFRNAPPQRNHYPTNRGKTSDLLDQIKNNTLGFEKVFVINLATRIDHRDSMILNAALSNVSLNWINGIRGDQLLEKVLPLGDSKKHLRTGDIGAWRAHVNAIATIVEENVATAIIMEDDIDWDVRIKSQLQDFALASRALTQPLSSDPSRYADPTFPSPKGPLDQSIDFSFDSLPRTVPPHRSPYGDNWDVLWLGHCGMRLPNTKNHEWAPASQKTAKGRVIHLNDQTVPEKEYLNLLSKDEDDIRKNYPQHTRMIHHPLKAQCSLAYAVTQASARRILYELSIKSFNNPYDIMLREYCEGSGGHRYHSCLTVQPQLFNHHRPVGRTSSYSEISSDWGDDPVTKASTENIRWSSRMNYEQLLYDETNFVDQFPNKT